VPTATEVLRGMFACSRGAEFAGHFANGKFHHCISSNAQLPAAAYLLDHLKQARKGSERDATLFSNIPVRHWIREYFRNVIAVPKVEDVKSSFVASHLPKGEMARGQLIESPSS
jgi:hypothetical protein